MAIKNHQRNLKIYCYKTEKKTFVNIYKYYSNQIIWPRGFPLKFIKEKVKSISKLKKNLVTSPIQQFLADGEPDVDAIFRLLFPSNDFKKSKLSQKDRHALEILGLEYGTKWQDIQKRFKALVKKYHPDKNQGSKKYEDILKKITLAYSQLKNTVNKEK